MSGGEIHEDMAQALSGDPDGERREVDAEAIAAWEAWDYPKSGETPYTAFLFGFAAGKAAR